MTPSGSTMHFFRGLGLVLCLGLAPEVAVAQSEKAPKVDWDQVEVAGIAERLADHAWALYRELQKAPDATVGSGYSRAYFELKHTLRRIKTESRHLSAMLDDGKGEPETYPSYEDLVELFEDARHLARQIFVWSSLKRVAGDVRDDLNALAPYYGGRQFKPLEL